MKHLQESILDSNYNGEKLPTISYGDLINPDLTFVHYFDYDENEAGVASLIMKPLKPYNFKSAKAATNKIIPLDTALAIPNKDAAHNIWQNTMSQKMRDKIKDNAIKWFKSRLNSAGLELVKLHGLDVKFNGFTSSGRYGDEYSDCSIAFCIGKWKVIQFDFNFNRDWEENVKVK